jgi:transcriptional regulator with XRE-family HTH domain
MQGIGAFIRRKRDECDLSLREFAKRLDCSAAFISDVELGRRHPSDEVLEEIARVLRTSVDEIRTHDVRAPIDEIKRLTRENPTFALAFRTMVDRANEKEITADELLAMVQSKEGRKPKRK